MDIDRSKRNDEQFYSQVARALVKDDWAGTQALFLLQQEGPLPKDAENANLGLSNLIEVGLIKLKAEEFSLTEKGTEVVDKILEKLGTDPLK